MLTCSSKGLYQSFIYSCFYKILTLVKNCKQGTRKSHIIITHTHQLFLHLPHLLYSPFLSLFPLSFLKDLKTRDTGPGIELALNKYWFGVDR